MSVWRDVKKTGRGLGWSENHMPVTITKIVVGSGRTNAATEEIVDLAQPQQEAGIIDALWSEAGGYKITFEFSSGSAAFPFRYSEFGIFAKENEGLEKEEPEEFLYAYSCIDNDFESGPEISPSARPPAVIRESVYLKAANAEQVTVTVAQEVSREEFEILETRVNVLEESGSGDVSVHASRKMRHMFIQTNDDSLYMESKLAEENFSFVPGDAIMFVPTVSNAAGATLDMGTGMIALWDPISEAAVEANALVPNTPYMLVCEITGESSRWSVQLPYLQCYTTSGTQTWTAPYAGFYEVIVTGGGGGAGGASSLGGNYSAGGGGGGAGTAIAKIWLSKGTAVSVTVGGAGSTGTAAANGGDGGTSSFGVYCSATGGTGGISAYNSSSSLLVMPGGGSGMGVGGYKNFRGIIGGSAIFGSNPSLGTWILAGTGGASYWSGGAQPSFDSNNSNSGFYGSGGGGAAASTSTVRRGSAGGVGVVQIRFLGGTV